MNRIKNWWQSGTTSDESLIDSDTPAWLISLVVNICILVALALFGRTQHSDHYEILSVETPVIDEEDLEELKPEEFVVSPESEKEIGALSENGVKEAESLAPEVSEDIPEIPEIKKEVFNNPDTFTPFEISEIDVNPIGIKFSETRLSRGHSGVGTTGAKGAIDQITREIILSLKERKTHVCWLFDQSVSLSQQRIDVIKRFDRIYEELGVIETSGNPAFAKYEDKPLLTSVVAFGSKVNFMTSTPTDNISEIKRAVNDIKDDRSGKELAFQAVGESAVKFRKMTLSRSKNKRNVMIIVFTDEVGDDRERLDQAIALCRKSKMPVYVVGAPAPFGRAITKMKWIDPDPKFDQTPQWGVVNQGPESLYPERIHLHFTGDGRKDDPIDSGFGSYALTRLSYETGGIYFSIHPNRNSRKAVSRYETANLSAHLKYFFDAHVMKYYKPDYVSISKYNKQLAQNQAKAALVKAARLPWVTPLSRRNLTFPKRNEAELAKSLTDAQKAAAKLEPKVNLLYNTLALGEKNREQLGEKELRWKAGYDLAMGRALAAKVRTESMNYMLAEAKTKKFKNKKNNTWNLAPSSIGEAQWNNSMLKKQAQKADFYLSRVVKEHKGTPWALLAQKELDIGLGWAWRESFTPMPKPRPPRNNNNPPPPPQNDKLKMMKKPPPKRKLPPL